MNMERRKIAELIPYTRNARMHSDDQIERIAASIREFGWTNPVLVDGQNGVIAGHGRLRAAQLLGIDEVPIVELSHLTPEQRRAYVLADNQLAIGGASWDTEMLAFEISGLKEFGFDVGLLGFSADELHALLSPAEPGLTDPDEAPEAPATATSATGDLWLLGRHRVLCGDSTSVEEVSRLMGAEVADCLWTDPPYNVAYEGSAGAIANDDMSATAFADFLAAAFACAASVLKPGSAVYVAHADTEGLAFRRAFLDAGFKLSSCLVWRKNSLVLGRSDYQWQHEPILYGWKKGASHAWYGGRDKTTVLDFARPTRSAEHPTMKPVALVETMVVNSTRVDKLVLDLFGGSGTTLIACERLGRRARLMEVDGRFADVIVRRWQDYTGGVARLEGTNQSFSDVTAERQVEAA